MLNRLSTVIDISGVGLDKDDRLDAINNANSLIFDRIRKGLIALFKEEGLSITIKTNLIETDFLDDIFNLATEKNFFFEGLIIHHSTSTPFLTTHLSSNSCLKWSAREFKEEFDSVKSVYETVLTDSGRFSLISFNISNIQNALRNRNRKVI